MENEINTLKKDLGIVEDLSDIRFLQIHKENYKTEVNENSFGEKLATLYIIRFSIFNFVYCMKLLVFIYESSCEILKLDLKLQDEVLQKEMEVCRNFLQRSRNINSTFLNLKKFSRFCEARRLIINIVLKKEPRISLYRNDEDALCIKYTCDSPNIMIEICWKIGWDLKNCDILDTIEVYYNNFELPNAQFIQEELEALTHPSLEFNIKLKLWKQLISDLSEHTRPVIVIDNEPNDQSDNVLVISDSDEDRSEIVDITNSVIYVTD